MMNKGFIQLLVIIVLFVVILSLFGVSFTSLFNDKTTRENFAFLFNNTRSIWRTYLSSPARVVVALWVRYVWIPFTESMDRIRQGESPVDPSAIPQVPGQ